jgi:outer membrane biosynthesis protein TonB
VTNPISLRLEAVQADLLQAEKQLKRFHQDLDSVNQRLDDFAGERQQYQLLDDICSSLDKLGELGAANLFWGEDNLSQDQVQQLERVHTNVAEFQRQVGVIETDKQSLLKRIDDQLDSIELLKDDVAELEEQEERAKYDYLVDREERPLPYRPMVMPWSKQGEDESRFRKSLALVFLFVFALTGLVNVWELPEIKNDVVEIPEHLVKLVKKDKPQPKPPEKKAEEKPKEDKPKDEKKSAEEKPQPTPAETQQARKKAESSGVLAFKDNFANLLADDMSAKLGAAARLSNQGAKASGESSRNLVMAQAKDSSGGISTASLSRNVGGGAGKQIGSGVSFSRVESAIGTDMGDDRPLSDGPGPARTDEEIQIVFDRYKAALYRIYNRELRNNPLLKGKMVLRITIEPDGSVSQVKIESTDMDSPTLSSGILARVQKFNFGPKDGVPRTTILYPIDFLPAT